VRYANGTLDVPGSPRVVFSPGHTYGHCALHLPDGDVLLAAARRGIQDADAPASRMLT
jgi:glyoxylase-like metal-dependent hydrolase (beta-lactamase superfamily II)